MCAGFKAGTGNGHHLINHLPGDRWQTPEILKPWVGPERIEDRARADRRIESRLIGLVQPGHRPVVFAKSDMDQRNTRVLAESRLCRLSSSWTIFIASSFRPEMAYALARLDSK